MKFNTNPYNRGFLREKTMSWFRRKPKIKEPQKHFPHHRRSPISEKMLEEAKQTGPKYLELNDKSINKK